MRAVWRPALLLACAAAVPLFAAQQSAPLLKALRWAAPGADRVALLTRAPGECLQGPTTPAVEIGRAAFRSPLLLGGQAARAGLSCESCHRNGRGNPQFHFPGNSGVPGTADVTASLFSTKRGDGIANPRPIPDLGAGPRKVTTADLEPFIAGLIVEEFDGAPPPPAVLRGLAAYVTALDPSACPVGDTAVTAGATIADARRAAAAGQSALAAGDAATAVVMLQAARADLGLLAERYPDAREQALIRESDTALAAILAAIRAGDRQAPAKLAQWNLAVAKLGQTLAAAEHRSLFNPAVLMIRLAPGA